MIELDGSFGEGGGQILRTALTLASLTGSPFRIYNLRAGRKRPGLRPQHVLSAEAAARVTGGRLEGCKEGSQTLTYLPGSIKAGRYFFDTGTAGSVTLIFQTILAPLAFAAAKSSITIKGGTHVPWSPPADYIEEIFLPALSLMGLNASFSTHSDGYYPGGGGAIEASINPISAPLAPLRMRERGNLLKVRILSTVSNLPVSIAERQLKSAASLLWACPATVEAQTREASSPGRGTSVFIVGEFENARAGFSALGAIGKRAEAVGIEAAQAFLKHLDRNAALDPHLADQILIYMAIAKGESFFTTSEITSHLLTNIQTIETFLPVKFMVSGLPGSEGTVAVEGAGLELRVSG
ncbi:MAG: RNA 3'-phosphate cyclase [Deltaproteobacteria bacterium]|nr:RNA 3'-phosphate cyclase [Deltaproteobacteria bacterium]